MTLKPIQNRTCIIRNTAASKGRNITVTPENSGTNFLYYGRTILDPGDDCDPGGSRHA